LRPINLIAENPELAAAYREEQNQEIERTMWLAEIMCIPFDKLLRRIEHIWDDAEAGDALA
jgi:hypothetical protein